MEEAYQIIKHNQSEALKYMLQDGFDPNSVLAISSDTSIPEHLRNQPPLISIAAYFGSIDCIDVIYSAHADISLADKSTPPVIPLEFSIISDNLQAFKKLLSLGSKLSGCAEFCVRHSKLQFLEFIVKSCGSSQIEEYTKALETAIAQSKAIFVPALLGGGAIPSSQIIDKVFSENQQDLIQVFRSFGFKQNEAARTTQLHTACEAGNLDEVKAIIESGKYDINCRDGNGETPLFKAAHKGSVSMAQYILSRPGVDPNIPTNGLRTPLAEACYRSRAEVVSLLLNTPGVDPTIKTNVLLTFPKLLNLIWSYFFAHRTILHCAAKSAKEDVISMILSTGKFHPNDQDNAGDTPLHIAARNRNVAAINLFMEVPEIRFNIRNKGGRAAFDQIPRNFISQFRSKMDQIIAESRRKKQEEKRAKTLERRAK